MIGLAYKVAIKLGIDLFNISAGSIVLVLFAVSGLSGEKSLE